MTTKKTQKKMSFQKFQEVHQEQLDGLTQTAKKVLWEMNQSGEPPFKETTLGKNAEKIIVGG